MKIHQLEKSKGLKDKQRRRGRGNATGTGNYSSRGLKGQKSRSGSSRKAFFEGGQTSIVQRLPKARGFKRYYKFQKKVTIINLGTLDADTRIVDGVAITKSLLKELGYIRNVADIVKILGHGDYAKQLTFIEMNAISASAQQKIDKPGTVHSVPRKAPVKVIASKKIAPKKMTKKKANISSVVEKKAPTKKSVEQKVPAKEVTTKKVVSTADSVKKPATKKAVSTADSAKKPTTKKAVTKKPAVKKTK